MSTRDAIRVDTLHDRHPKIRAKDWRSPVVARLIANAAYSDGACVVVASIRPADGAGAVSQLPLEWRGLEEDYAQCLNTYQAPVVTEFAALGIACILCSVAELEITEVTRRGDKVDYWLGDRDLLLEVSGTVDGDLSDLCATKAQSQLRKNPFEKDGYVCAVRFTTAEARLWFFHFKEPRIKKQ